MVLLSQNPWHIFSEEESVSYKICQIVIFQPTKFMFFKIFLRSRKNETQNFDGSSRQGSRPQESIHLNRRHSARVPQQCGPVVFSMPTNAFNSQLG
jgi:hypothetical protein